MQMSQLWDEMEVAAAEREDFAPLAVGPEGYCDDLLAVHEQEVREQGGHGEGGPLLGALAGF